MPEREKIAEAVRHRVGLLERRELGEEEEVRDEEGVEHGEAVLVPLSEVERDRGGENVGVEVPHPLTE